MHLTELAAPVARDTLSSYEVVGVSTVLAEQVGEKAGQEKHEPQTSRKQQKLQGLSTSRHQKSNYCVVIMLQWLYAKNHFVLGQKTSEKRRSRRRTEVVQRVDEPIRVLYYHSEFGMCVYIVCLFEVCLSVCLFVCLFVCLI